MTSARLTCRAAPGTRRTGSRAPACRSRPRSAAPGQRQRWPVLRPWLERLGSRRRVEQRLEDAVDVREQVHVQARPARPAERVVEPGVAEVVEPAREVGRVRAGGRELGRRLRERLRGRRERALADRAVARRGADGDVAQRLGRAGQLDEVVVLAGRVDRLRQVAQRRPRVAHERAQLGEERAQLLRDRLRLLDERRGVVERRAEVDERRVRPAHEVGQLRRSRGRARRSGARGPPVVVERWSTSPASCVRRCATSVDEASRSRR